MSKKKNLGEVQIQGKTKEAVDIEKIKSLIDESIPSYYVRFHQAVPPAEDKEPVSEFRLKSKQTKYIVDSIHWTKSGIVYKAFGEINIVSLANVVYCRFNL